MASRSSSPSSSSPAPPPPATRRHRVVIVEDQQILRELIVLLLQESPDFEVVGEAGTAAAGLHLCRETLPDLVIVDWLLPDGKGVDVVRIIATEQPAARFLALTAHPHDHIVREMASAGAHGFLLKGSSTDTLRAAMQQVMQGDSFYLPPGFTMPATKATANTRTLTSREVEILRGIAQGENPKSVAGRLGVSPKTINNQLTHLKAKLRIQDTAGLVRYAVRHGLSDPV